MSSFSCRTHIIFHDVAYDDCIDWHPISEMLKAQRIVQNAALRFERACSQQTAAKEMVNLAEQGYFAHGQPFDPAWQEMLNHGTMKVSTVFFDCIVDKSNFDQIWW